MKLHLTNIFHESCDSYESERHNGCHIISKGCFVFMKDISSLRNSFFLFRKFKKLQKSNIFFNENP